jgi:hypothetical protein
LHTAAPFRGVAPVPAGISCCAALRDDLNAFERDADGSQMEVTGAARRTTHDVEQTMIEVHMLLETANGQTSELNTEFRDDHSISKLFRDETVEKIVVHHEDRKWEPACTITYRRRSPSLTDNEYVPPDPSVEPDDPFFSAIWRWFRRVWA